MGNLHLFFFLIENLSMKTKRNGKNRIRFFVEINEEIREDSIDEDEEEQ